MRPIFIGIGLLLLICGGAALAAFYSSTPSKTTRVYVLWDITDKETTRFDTADIISMYNLEGSGIWNGGEFSFKNLTDVSYGKSITYSLASENQWLGNEYDRAKTVRQFETAVGNTLAATKETATGKANSSLYIPITDALTELATNKATSRNLILVSDLMENTSTISFYAPRVLNQMQKEPDKVIAALERIGPMPSLNGIHVYLLYYPTTQIEDKNYRIVSTFYRSFFEKKGATVTIGTLQTNKTE